MAGWLRETADGPTAVPHSSDILRQLWREQKVDEYLRACDHRVNGHCFRASRPHIDGEKKILSFLFSSFSVGVRSPAFSKLYILLHLLFCFRNFWKSRRPLKPLRYIPPRLFLFIRRNFSSSLSLSPVLLRPPKVPLTSHRHSERHQHQAWLPRCLQQNKLPQETAHSLLLLLPRICLRPYVCQGWQTESRPYEASL